MGPLALRYDAAEGRDAAEFLLSWLPFLSDGLCNHCERTISYRIRSLNAGERFEVRTPLVTEKNWSERHKSSYSSDSLNDSDTHSPCSFTANSSAKRSWDEMYHDDEYVSSHKFVNVYESCEEMSINGVKERASLSRDQREYTGFCNVRRKKDFVLMERVNGEFLNVVDGLELHTGVFSAEEQKRIVSHVEWLEDIGRKRLLKGILRSEMVDPIPELFKTMIKRLVRWHVLPVSCVPDSCIVNIYEEGDCIPPHIDNHDFVRPFCTVSFLSERQILFGSNLKIMGAGEFMGSLAVPLPVGSVLVINGNGADVAKHCVPAVPARRISITFRKMCRSKLPVGYVSEPDLVRLRPFSYDSVRSSRPQPSITHYAIELRNSSRKTMVERDGIHKGGRLVPRHEDRLSFLG